MNKEKLANDILKKANEFTNWGFTMKNHEGAYLIGTSMDSDQLGMKMHIVYDINERGVAMSIFIPGCKYDEVKAATVFEGLQYPFMITGKSGEMFMARSNVAYSVLANETEEFVEGLVLAVISTVKAVTDILTK